MKIQGTGIDSVLTFYLYLTYTLKLRLYTPYKIELHHNPINPHSKTILTLHHSLNILKDAGKYIKKKV